MEAFWYERHPLTTVLGFSSSIVPCLITGCMPRDTGVWTEYYRHDRVQSSWAKVVVGSRVLLTPVNIARLIAFRVARLRGMPAAHRLRIPLQFAHIFERHDMDYRRFPPVSLPVPTLIDVAQDLGLLFDFRYLGHAYDADTELSRLEKNYHDADVFFFYDASIDHYGHHRGASAHLLRPELDRLSGFVQRATRLLESDAEVEILLFSDHGMTNVSTAFDLVANLRGLLLGRDYLMFIDSTFARFWYLRSGVRERIHQRLTSAPASFLTEEEKHRYGIDFSDTRYGEDILVAEEGVVFHPSYISPPLFRTKSYPDVATHGYRPEASTASGICFYRGNTLSDGFPEVVPATNIFDYASTIMRTIVARQ
jgi:hypothetical protein